MHDQISLTNRLLPQYIFLGESAFDSMIALQETVVHELSHIWYGFISEVFDFQTPDSPTDFVLPSGTKNRNVTIVFFAALFAAAAIKFYQRFNENSTSVKTAQRLNYLNSYLDGCIDLLNNRKYISTMGNLILERLTSLDLHAQSKGVAYA